MKHIKGIEFRAVFLLGFDRMYASDPDLAARYLYVELRRAVMFLGVSVEHHFPEQLGFIRGEFREGTWSGFTATHAISS